MPERSLVVKKIGAPKFAESKLTKTTEDDKIILSFNSKKLSLLAAPIVPLISIRPHRTLAVMLPQSPGPAAIFPSPSRVMPWLPITIPLQSNLALPLILPKYTQDISAFPIQAVFDALQEAS